MKKIIIAAIIAAATLTACTTPQNAPEASEAVSVSSSTVTEQETTSSASEEPEVIPEVTEELAPPPEVAPFEGLIGEWAGTYKVKDEDENDNVFETDEAQTVILEVKEDGTWVCTYGKGSRHGVWENITTSGRAISLLIDYDDGDGPQDNDWTFSYIDKPIFTFASWYGYNVEMTKL